ncbi:MAG: FAD-binding dehydrogenase [Maribacter sp.]|nr:FAD-binding dehydrogenase [Maribacter sp.]
MTEKKYQSDVIVIGGGIAGIVTALELLEKGRKVILLERGPKKSFGGLAISSFGGMFFVDTREQRRFGMKDSVDLALSDWFAVANFKETDVLPKKWAEQYVNMCTPYVYNYLKRLKIKFFPVVHWVERGLYKPGNSYPRFHIVWGTGYGLTKTLIENLLNHPKKESHLQLFFDHKVDGFLVQNNVVIGVQGTLETDSTQKFEVNAEHTVVAAGGMGGNIERVKKNWYKPWGEPPEKILNGSSIFADGAMHDAVANVNGNLTHLDKNWPYPAGVHHPRPQFENHGLSLVPCKSALWLDYTGKRFGPEPLITAYDTRHIVEKICEQKKKYSWQILNMKIAYKEFAISGSESNASIRDKNYFQFIKSVLLGNKKLVHDMLENCQDFVIGNTLEELVDKMNALQQNDDVKIQNVQQAVLSYDEMTRRPKKFQNDEQLRRIAHTRQYMGDRSRTCKNQPIFDKQALPLIAIREFILSRKTLGGIQTDLNGRVLTTPLNGSQKTIPGLYAVGEASGFGGGGMHGEGALEGTFLGGCVLTARVVAADIAGQKLGDR